MYGPIVRDESPSRKHLPSVLDIEPGHSQKHGHPFLWLLTVVAGAAMTSWYLGLLPR